MKKLILPLLVILAICYFVYKNTRNSDIKYLLKNKNGVALSFNSIKTAKLEGGTAVIVDKSWCFWIDKNDRVYCVNGAAKGVMKYCMDAPIVATFSDIEKIVE